MAYPLIMETPDHTSCVVSIGIDIPKGNIFMFENYWMEHDQFIDVVAHGWPILVNCIDKAKGHHCKVLEFEKSSKGMVGTVI